MVSITNRAQVCGAVDIDWFFNESLVAPFQIWFAIKVPSSQHQEIRFPPRKSYTSSLAVRIGQCCFYLKTSAGRWVLGRSPERSPREARTNRKRHHARAGLRRRPRANRDAQCADRADYLTINLTKDRESKQNARIICLIFFQECLSVGMDGSCFLSKYCSRGTEESRGKEIFLSQRQKM